MRLYFLIFVFFIVLTMPAREVMIGEQCEFDPKLTLEKIVLNEDNTIIFFTYQNDDNPRKRIGLYPPESTNSFYIEDISTKQKYKLIDAEGLPKWWPKEIKFLSRYEEVTFQLIFPPLPATFAIHIIEGEGNEESDQAWNFKHVEIADIHTLNEKVIEYVQKESLSATEQNVLQKAAQDYEHIADFVQVFPTNNWNSYEQKWSSELDAKEMLSFIQYEKTNAEQREEYAQIKERNLINEYIQFIEKYCAGDCENSPSEFVRDAVIKVKAFFDRKQRELVIEGSVESYNNTLSQYADNPYAKNIVSDYNQLAETAFNNSLAFKTEEQIANFISKFPYSDSTEKAWEELNKRYLETNEIDEYEAYLSKYPQSPHYDEMAAKKEELEQKKVREAHIMNTLDSFKSTLNQGDEVSFTQTYRVRAQDNQEEMYVFEIQYFGTIVHILTRDVRIRVTDSKIILQDTIMNETIQDYYDQMSLLTVGGLETVPISRLDSFPNK